MESKWMEAMRRGDFAAAWKETDRLELRRRQLERDGKLVWHPRYLLWNGEPFQGRRVLIRCTHGLGDTLQFLRYVPKLRAMAREVTILVQPALLGLLSGGERFGNVRNGWTGEASPAHDVEIEVMELAYAFRSTPATLPREVPYLPTAPLCGAAIPVGMEAPRTLKIGVIWAASDWDPRRSIPLKLLDPLCHIPGIRFHSLQHGDAAAEGTASALGMVPLSSLTRTVESAAAAMMQMDLILTVDTMAAHLAGALGRPVWVLLQYDADWRWQTGRSDSPWYPTMRLFRQPAPGAWQPVVEQVRTALSSQVGASTNGA